MITCCPFELITRDVYEMLDAASMARKGSWFEPGGWGDQTRCAVDAIRVIWNETDYWRAKLRHRQED